MGHWLDFAETRDREFNAQRLTVENERVDRVRKSLVHIGAIKMVIIGTGRSTIGAPAHAALDYGLDHDAFGSILIIIIFSSLAGKGALLADETF